MRYLSFFPFMWFALVLGVMVYGSQSWGPVIIGFPFGVITLLWSLENLGEGGDV